MLTLALHLQAQGSGTIFKNVVRASCPSGCDRETLRSYRCQKPKRRMRRGMRRGVRHDFFPVPSSSFHALDVPLHTTYLTLHYMYTRHSCSTRLGHSRSEPGCRRAGVFHASMVSQIEGDISRDILPKASRISFPPARFNLVRPGPNSLSHSAHSELIDANGWRGGRAPGVLLSGYVLLATTSSAFFLLDVRNAWGHAGAFGPAR